MKVAGWHGIEKTDLLRLVERFDQIGLKSSSNLMFDLNRPHAALQMSQFASDLRSENNMKRAAKFFDRAIEVYPYCVPALVGQGEMVRQQALKLGEDDMQERLIALQTAADKYEMASKIDPLCTPAIVGRTNVLIDQNKITEAISELKKFLIIDPSRAEVHAILGRLYFSNRKLYRGG